MICMVFTDEAAVQAAKDQVWLNYLNEIHSIEPAKIKNDTGIPYDELTREQLLSLKVKGEKDGHLVDQEGLTSAYLSVAKAWQIELWFCKKPADESLLDGVTGYTEQPFDPGWIEPI